MAGDTAKWLITLADYPASAGWVLAYELANSAGALSFSASASGDAHLVTVSAATTAAWVAGDYAWRAKVSLAGEVYTVREGRITVAPSFGTAVETRSTARQALDAVRAYLKGAASSAVLEYQIAGRQLRHYAMADLLALESRLAMEVQREDAVQAMARGDAPAGRVLVRFGR